MFKLALNMYVADMKKLFRSFWWIAPIFLIVIVIGPFHDVGMYYWMYLIMMVISFMMPKTWRIHFVVPLSEKQIRQLFIWRIVLICGFMALVGALVIGISEWKNLEWSRYGIGTLVFYMVLLMLFSENGLQGMGIKNKFEVRHVIAILIGVMSLLIPFDFVSDKMSAWMLVLTFVLLLASIIYMLHYLKKVKFEDYTYRPFTMWDNKGEEY